MIVAMLRVKNEARWILDVLRSALEVCERAYVLDDHSTDGTPDICREFGDRVRLYHSPFEGLDESRDKNWLLEVIRKAGGEWILSIDGDELLETPRSVAEQVASGHADCYSFRVLYLWDRRDQVRLDGVYGRFWRPSLFRLGPGDSFRATTNGGNFHCGNVPSRFAHSAKTNVKLLHFGYMDVRDRQRKFAWYNENDPHNGVEDGYRHMIQGDPGGPPASLILRHAGPLTLATV